MHVSILRDADLITIESKETQLKNCLVTTFIFSRVLEVLNIF
jgi:hypothetical protein